MKNVKERFVDYNSDLVMVARLKKERKFDFWRQKISSIVFSTFFEEKENPTER